MSRLIVVSNRVSPPESRSEGAAGGLAVALAAALREYSGFWFGWSGETVAAFTGAVTQRTVDDVTVATVDLEESDYQEYYNGYANGTLWPLFHYRIDLTAYDRSFSEGYERVNRRFAESLAPLIEPGDVVWVHDYHLMLLGRELRRLGVDNPIGFFLHIPWPAPQVLTTLPRHRQLAPSSRRRIRRRCRIPATSRAALSRWLSNPPSHHVSPVRAAAPADRPMAAHIPRPTRRPRF